MAEVDHNVQPSRRTRRQHRQTGKRMEKLHKIKGRKTSTLIRLHRTLATILFLQVLIWAVTGFYFSWQGREALSATQYHQRLDAETIATQSLQFPVERVARLGEVYQVELRMVDGIAQFKVATANAATHGSTEIEHQDFNYVWFDGTTGRPWFTSTVTAQRLAVNSYTGPGMFAGLEQINRSSELVGWRGRGFRAQFADGLNTRVYIDEASGEVIGHRNDPWVIADWMYRLHFMDYSGARNFNNILISTLGLLCLWFVLSGILLIVRIWQQGGFVARRRFPYNKRLFKNETAASTSVADKN
ncbi:MAG: PepSY domain-containing protein [Gammaproteobacteria bacterium]|nr:PepSY domain-containing protein [Gammaproteobacteria bacterium]